MLGKLVGKRTLCVAMILLTLGVVVSTSGCLLAMASAAWEPSTVAILGSTDGYIWITNLSPITLTVTDKVTWVRDPDGLKSYWVTGGLGASRECPPFTKTMIVHVSWGIAIGTPTGTFTYHYTVTFTDGQTATCDATITITP